jgi:hypothetical protein
MYDEVTAYCEESVAFLQNQCLEGFFRGYRALTQDFWSLFFSSNNSP